MIYISSLFCSLKSFTIAKISSRYIVYFLFVMDCFLISCVNLLRCGFLYDSITFSAGFRELKIRKASFGVSYLNILSSLKPIKMKHENDETGF